MDLTSWETKIAEEMEVEFETDEKEVAETINVKELNSSNFFSLLF